MTEKEKKAKEYKEKFERLLAEEETIYSMDKSERLVLDENIIWKQCYCPYDKIRKDLPTYWFVDKNGNVTSVSYNKIILVKARQVDDKGEYKAFSYCYTDDKGQTFSRNIRRHHLVNIIFDGLKYGIAEKKLLNEGRNAFLYSDEQLNVHHIDNDKTNNNIENLELITKRIHDTMNAVPAEKQNDKKNFNYMKKLCDVCSSEEPNRITVYIDSLNIINGSEYK